MYGRVFGPSPVTAAPAAFREKLRRTRGL